MYLLDTNVISELRRVAMGRGAARVAGWQASVAGQDCFLSVITIMEIELGALRKQRHDPVQGDYLLDWLRTTVLPTFDDRILSVTLPVARYCARIHVPDPQPERDALIAATARVHDLVVVTRNTRDFVGTGVLLLNPWESTAIHEAPADYGA
ncbi:MAG: type II toxin-antitoxin system VapC family toxin [Salinisphaera sp.]|nr:type II toxin-antitoxin system VapC family toxin [Salinisphaera sp.]